MSILRKFLIILLPFVFLIFNSCLSSAGNRNNSIEKPSENIKILSFYNGPDDTEKAIEAIEKLEDEKMDRQTRFIYHSLLISNKNFDEAIEQLKILLSEDNGDIEALSAYVSLLDYKNDKIERDRQLNHLLKIDPDNSNALSLKASIALRTKKYKESEKIYLRSLMSDPTNIDSHIGRGHALMHIEGREEESVESFDIAESLDPGNPFVYSDRARVHRFLKDYGRAEDDLSKAISIDPTEWNYLDRARIRINHLDDKNGAKEDLQKILELNGNNFFANVYLAGMYEDEGLVDESLSHYEKIISETDDYYYAYPALGKLYFMKGNWVKAAEMYEKASYSPLDDMTYPLMAFLSFRQIDEKKKAKEILNKNIGKLDRNSSIYEMYRYYLNPNSPYFVQTAMNKDNNELMRDRMKFYLAMIDKLNGLESTSAALLGEIAFRKGANEFILASHILEN